MGYTGVIPMYTRVPLNVKDEVTGEQDAGLNKKKSTRGRTLGNRSILTEANTEGQMCLANSYRMPISLIRSYGFYLYFSGPK